MEGEPGINSHNTKVRSEQGRCALAANNRILCVLFTPSDRFGHRLRPSMRVMQNVMPGTGHPFYRKTITSTGRTTSYDLPPGNSLRNRVMQNVTPRTREIRPRSNRCYRVNNSERSSAEWHLFCCFTTVLFLVFISCVHTIRACMLCCELCVKEICLRVPVPLHLGGRRKPSTRSDGKSLVRNRRAFWRHQAWNRSSSESVRVVDVNSRAVYLA